MTSRRREQGREAAAISPTRVPSAGALISFDPDVPAKSSRSGDILRVITRTLPAKNSRKRFLWKRFLWKLDAEIPRFAFGRVLQRPAGSRSRRSRGLSRGCSCDYRSITSDCRDHHGRRDRHDLHRVRHRRHVRRARRHRHHDRRVRRHNRHRRRVHHHRPHHVRLAASPRSPPGCVRQNSGRSTN